MILLIIQGFKNNKYNDFNLIKIIKERVLYEQITYEIYENIKNLVILDLKVESICEDNYKPINFTIKLNPYYNFKYNTNITHLFNKQFCIPKYELFQDKYNESELKYEELIKHSVNKEEIVNNNLGNICENGYKPCGILDTKNNILCFPIKYNCPLNDLIISNSYDYDLIDNGYSQVLLDNNISIYLNTNENIDRPIIISIFLSFDKPWEHEWQEIIAYKEGEKYEDENKKREEFLFENYDKYMISTTEQNKFYISLDNIKYWEKIDNFSSKIKDIELEDLSKFYNVFYKNYIGFKNYEELKNFIKIFNMNDYKDNPLYKFSKTLVPYIASEFFCFLFAIIFLIAFCQQIYLYYQKKDLIECSYILVIPFNFVYCIIYISLYFSDYVKFKKLEFNFDEQIQKIFDLYTKRNNRPIYKSAIIIMLVTLSPYLLLLGIYILFSFYELYIQIKKYCGFCGIF